MFRGFPSICKPVLYIIMISNPNSRFPVRDSNRKIFLVGMPGAGKTYWGQKLAQEYKLEFTDLDVFIAGQEQATIPALFAQYGESGFREKESKYLMKLIKTTDVAIIACGGGAPCFHRNMALMKEAGIVIYLQADIETLMHNIQKSDEIRPLLKGKANIGGYLKGLLHKRTAFYEQAHFILQTKNISLITFDEIISSCINKL